MSSSAIAYWHYRVTNGHWRETRLFRSAEGQYFWSIYRDAADPDEQRLTGLIPVPPAQVAWTLHMMEPIQNPQPRPPSSFRAAQARSHAQERRAYLTPAHHRREIRLFDDGGEHYSWAIYGSIEDRDNRPLSKRMVISPDEMPYMWRLVNGPAQRVRLGQMSRK